MPCGVDLFLEVAADAEEHLKFVLAGADGILFNRLARKV
jgi:hypothetical protein